MPQEQNETLLAAVHERERTIRDMAQGLGLAPHAAAATQLDLTEGRCVEIRGARSLSSAKGCRGHSMCAESICVLLPAVGYGRASLAQLCDA